MMARRKSFDRCLPILMFDMIYRSAGTGTSTVINHTPDCKGEKMGVIQEFFNNREIAIGVWVIIGLAVILPTKPARQFIKTAIQFCFARNL